MKEKVLVLSPHTDDGEIGAGGTIAKFIENGGEVFYAAFSTCEKSISEEFPKDILKSEVRKATAVLGIKPENLNILDYPVREFSSRRQEILQEMIDINKKINPDIVFTPCSNDTHQDHEVISRESFRAFKKTSILGYEEPWNCRVIKSDIFVTLSESNINKKIMALKEYESQKRDYLNHEFIRSLAKVRGTQIGKSLAETFEVIRWIIK
ncbi:MAG: PIG-L family deacetylase [Candidatus Aenigmarchaeota archaeon]|nr:PIG-L family deacetylase [Candidatus Aenigmarchaeota archaeon]